jgi:hypothetical protein
MGTSREGVPGVGVVVVVKREVSWTAQPGARMGIRRPSTDAVD